MGPFDRGSADLLAQGRRGAGRDVGIAAVGSRDRMRARGQRARGEGRHAVGAERRGADRRGAIEEGHGPGRRRKAGGAAHDGREGDRLARA